MNHKQSDVPHPVVVYNVFITNRFSRETQGSSNRNGNTFCIGKSGGATISRADGSVEVLQSFVHEDEPKQKGEMLSGKEQNDMDTEIATRKSDNIDIV